MKDLHLSFISSKIYFYPQPYRRQPAASSSPPNLTPSPVVDTIFFKLSSMGSLFYPRLLEEGPLLVPAS